MSVCSLGTKEEEESRGKDGRLKSGPMTAPAEMENLIVCVCVYVCVCVCVCVCAGMSALFPCDCVCLSVKDAFRCTDTRFITRMSTSHCRVTVIYYYFIFKTITDSPIMTGSLHCWLALWILFWLHDDMIYSDKKTREICSFRTH